MLPYSLPIPHSGTNLVKFESKYNDFNSRKCIWKCHWQNVDFFRLQCVKQGYMHQWTRSSLILWFWHVTNSASSHYSLWSLSALYWLSIMAPHLLNAKPHRPRPRQNFHFTCSILKCIFPNGNHCILGILQYTQSWYNSYCDTLLVILFTMRYLWYLLLIFY